MVAQPCPVKSPSAIYWRSHCRLLLASWPRYQIRLTYRGCMTSGKGTSPTGNWLANCYAGRSGILPRSPEPATTAGMHIDIHASGRRGQLSECVLAYRPGEHWRAEAQGGWSRSHACHCSSWRGVSSWRRRFFSAGIADATVEIGGPCANDELAAQAQDWSVGGGYWYQVRPW